MERTAIFPAFLALAATVLASAFAAAQTSPDASAPQPRHVRSVAHPPMLFSPGPEKTKPAAAVEFRAYDRMSEHDRELEADAESSISERAGFAGLEFNEGRWSYRQIVCSALPGHLFLQFTRNNGAGDASLFTASIPRGGDGRVRIVPIVRRGYSLFSPAPINALTISAFNHIRAEERSSADSDQAPFRPAPEWLATGLCYAALAGAHPQIGPAEQTDYHKLPTAPTGRMLVPERGGAVIAFTDVAAPHRPMLWTMAFNAKGKLLKATHRPVPSGRTKTAERTPKEVQGKPVQASNPETKAILIKSSAR